MGRHLVRLQKGGPRLYHQWRLLVHFLVVAKFADSVTEEEAMILHLYLKRKLILNGEWILTSNSWTIPSGGFWATSCKEKWAWDRCFVHCTRTFQTMSLTLRCVSLPMPSLIALRESRREFSMPSRWSLAVGVVRCLCKLNRWTLFDQSRSAVRPGWSPRPLVAVDTRTNKAKAKIAIFIVKC